MLAALLLYVTFFLLPSDLERLGTEAIASTLFVANIYFWQVTDYFDIGAESRLLLHTWSLAVEEQFYIAFPLVLAALYRHWPKSLNRAVALALVCSLVFCVVMTMIKPVASFYLPPTRAWELLVGALLALGFFPAARSAAPFASLAGLGLIAGSLVLFDEKTVFPGIAAAIPVVGTALVIWAGAVPNFASRLISTRPFVAAGLISYSLYLWHWPLILIARRWLERELTGPEIIVYLLVTIAIATLSLKLVETPFRKSFRWMASDRVVAVGALSATTSVAIALAVVTNQGFPDRYPEIKTIQATYAKHRMLPVYRYRTCFLDEKQDASKYDHNDCADEGSGLILLWGDSHAAHLYPGLSEIVRRSGKSLVLAAASACPPKPGVSFPTRPKCRAFNDRILALSKNQQWDAVILAAEWRKYMGDWSVWSEQAKALQTVMSDLRTRGVPTYVIGQGATFEHSVPQLVMDRLIRKNESLNSRSLDTEGPDDFLSRLARKNGATFVPIAGAFCTNRDCRLGDSQGLYFWDHDHLTVKGSRRAAAFVAPKLRIGSPL
jgi:peptidoglycan/LPS O-acetylase OafA/YrhL